MSEFSIDRDLEPNPKNKWRYCGVFNTTYTKDKKPEVNIYVNGVQHSYMVHDNEVNGPYLTKPVNIHNVDFNLNNHKYSTVEEKERL